MVVANPLMISLAAALRAEDYFDDPVAWVHDMFDWERVGTMPTPYQDEILAAVPVHKRVCVRGPHGLGKTALASWLILWFALTRDGRDWKVPTTASAWRQLEKYLWPEIHKWARLLRWERLGRQPFTQTELLHLALKLKTGQAVAVASDVPESIEGAHADHLLYLLDESKAIPPGIFDAVEGAFSGSGEDTAAKAYALAISTPGEPSGRFYEIQSRKPGTEDWWVRHVTLDEALAAGRVSQEWAEQRARQWGAASGVYQNRVLGEFATDDESGVIPLAHIEAAVERWQKRMDAGAELPDFTCVGVDVARSGTDRTVIALRHHDIISELRPFRQTDVMEATGYAAGILTNHPGMGYAAVDVIGIGAGVVDRLREQEFDVYAFNASSRSEQVDLTGELGFINQRAASWWTMRELLDPANKFDIALPPDDMLIGDLTAPRWKITSAGKIQVESKEDIRKRLGRSTDAADACVMAFALRPQVEETTMVEWEDRVRISPY